ncbi:MAG TPA: hypothetical protein VHA05_03850 [Candidatus Saccharimonadales bacterium]|jgi:hypothetical protein|nr:hypothetical protein [Candidatus Saccharimonadales bacterium]
MKLFLALVFLVGSYLGMMFFTTNIVLGQVNNLNRTYQYVANNSDDIATGRKSVKNDQYRLNQDQQAILSKY